VVTAVRVSPKMALPLMVTVPVKIAVSVVITVAVLAGEAKWVSVAALRAMNEYCVFGVKPLNNVDDCQFVPLSLLYSQPIMVLSVMLFAVLLASVGAAGAVCVALITVAVAAEVILPIQFAAVTVTVIVLPMSP